MAKIPVHVDNTNSERLTALHEAGHAVIAQLNGQQITTVEIVGDAEHAGSVQSLRFPPDPAETGGSEEAGACIERRLRCTLAGAAIEALVIGREDWDERSEELDAAVRLAMQLVEDCERVLPYLEQVRREVEAELRHHWQAVEALAAELLERKALTGAEVRQLLTPYLSSP